MKKLTNKQRLYISELWYNSELKQSQSNLILQYTQHDKYDYYFTIGVYSFNSITETHHIEPLKSMYKLTFTEIEILLTKKTKL